MKIVKSFYIRPLINKRKWRGLRWKIVVVPTVKEVRKIYGQYAGKCIAFCRPYKDGKQCQKTGSIGCIILPLKAGSEIMAHEATHAAIRTVAFMQKGTTIRTKFTWNEELLCQVVGWISTCITRKMYQYGLWK